MAGGQEILQGFFLVCQQFDLAFLQGTSDNFNEMHEGRSPGWCLKNYDVL